MTTPWPDDLIRRVGLKNINIFRQTPKTELALMDFAGLTEEEKNLIISIGTDEEAPKPKQNTTTNSDYQLSLIEFRRRRVFIAAAWLAGASWAQLGALLSIRKATVRQAGLKELSGKLLDRQSQVLPSLETLAAWLNWYKTSAYDYTLDQWATKFLTIKDE